MASPLVRSTPALPVRHVHLGLGAFHRAHQAWYTHVAGDAGIAAFTGRRPDAAVPLAAQGGLYHLLVRSASGDQAELVTSLSGAYDGADLGAWTEAVASPEVGVLTLTVTEAAYRRLPSGSLDLSDPSIAADVASIPGGVARTVPGRLVLALASRRASDAGPLAVVPCDNLLDNGPTVASVVVSLAGAVSASLAEWISSNVSFVSTTIDRITPATTATDVAEVASLTGFADAAPVVTEPFTEWVLAGAFPSGRPAWETGGARFVDDVTPFEQRKLWLLNGSHSLLAYAAPLRGHATVADAVTDPVCRDWVEAWFELASVFLPFSSPDLAPYRASLLERYENPRIRHNLSQIAMDGSLKLPIRILPVVTRARAAGVVPLAGAVALAGWVAHLRRGVDVRDPRASELTQLAQADDEAAVRSLLGVLDATLAEDKELVDLIADTLRDLSGRPGAR